MAYHQHVFVPLLDLFCKISHRIIGTDAVKLFAWMVPGEVRTYPLTELDDAKAWLSET